MTILHTCTCTAVNCLILLCSTSYLFYSRVKNSNKNTNISTLSAATARNSWILYLAAERKVRSISETLSRLSVHLKTCMYCVCESCTVICVVRDISLTIVVHYSNLQLYNFLEQKSTFKLQTHLLKRRISGDMQTEIHKCCKEI